MMEGIKIYTLSDRNGVRYVGQTKNPKNRFNKHIFEASNYGGRNKRCSWIKSLLNKGEKPIMEIIDEVPMNEWAFWEQYWIGQVKGWGFNLVNDTLGGEGSYGRKHSDETKKKMSNSKKGKIPKNIGLLVKSSIKSAVLQYTLKGELLNEWESVNKAKCELGIENIDLVVKRKRNSAGGFIWRYVDEPITIGELELIRGKHNKQKPKKVLQLDRSGKLIKEWDSVNSVKKVYGHINAVLRGDRKSAGGYLWKYKESN